MPDFKFFAPGQAQLGGILAGAQGILAGGQAKGAGLAAEGQALGQAYANIGASLGAAITQRAEIKKEEELTKDLEAFAKGFDQDDLWEKQTYRDEDRVQDPVLRSIRDQAASQIGEGSDPNVTAAQKHAAYAESFQKRFGDSPEEAARKASELMKPQEDRNLSDKGRMLMIQGARALKKSGVPDFVIRSVVDSGTGSSGYPRASDANEASQSRIDKRYSATTPEAKRHQAVLQKEALDKQSDLHEQIKRSEVDEAVYKATTSPFSVPTPMGMIPTGARTQKRAQASVSHDLGVESSFVNRAEAVGLPTQEMVEELREPIDYTPVSSEQMGIIRAELKRAGLDVDKQLTQRRIFTGANDDNLQKLLKDRRREIEDGFLNDAPRFAGADAFSKSDRQLFTAMDSAVAERMAAGKVTDFVMLGQMENVDLDAVASALASRGGNVPTKEDLEQTRIDIGPDGRPRVVLNTMVDPSERARMSDSQSKAVESFLQAEVFPSNDVRDELILRQQLGPGRKMNATVVNKYMRMMRERHPDVVREWVRRVGADAGAAPADANAPPEPTGAPIDAGGGLTPAQRALLPTRSLTGADIEEREIPTAESNREQAAKRGGEREPGFDTGREMDKVLRKTGPMGSERAHRAAPKEARSSDLVGAGMALARVLNSSGQFSRGLSAAALASDLQAAIDARDVSEVSRLASALQKALDDRGVSLPVKRPAPQVTTARARELRGIIGDLEAAIKKIDPHKPGRDRARRARLRAQLDLYRAELRKER